MTKPLALVYYVNLLPGTQMANRLFELGYRVQVVESARLGQLVDLAKKEMPLLLIAEISSQSAASCEAITALRADAATQHIPVLAYAVNPDKALHVTAKSTGATLLANSQGILDQLPQLLDQILLVE
jgi:CheY-like chemotaxis protein